MANEERKYRWIVISVAFAAFMSRLDDYIVNISLPTISHYFNASTGEVSWVVLAYLLVTTSTLLFFGRLADKIGLGKLFVYGYVSFVAGSFLCGLSQSIHMLVASRIFQGIGGAMLIASGFAILPRFIPADRTGWAFGIVSTSAALGVVIGAPIGGFISGLFSWHWIFWVNIPVGTVAIVVAIRVLPEEKGERESAKGSGIAFDIPGTVLSFLGFLALLYGLNMGQELGWSSPSIILCFLASIFFLSVFFAWERKCKDPLLNFRLFKNLHFTFANLAGLTAFMLMAGNTFLLPFYLELVKGLKAEQAGLMMMVYSLVYVIVAPIAGRISDRIPPSLLCSAATLSAAACSFTFALTLKFQGFLFVILFLTWLGFSFGMFMSPNNNQVMRLAPAGEQGIASGVFNTVNSLGLVFGVCLFETVFSGASSADGGLVQAKVSPEVMLSGFRVAYLLGGVFCVVAWVFSLLTRASDQRENFKKK
jgi:EmrB/QacA subfamily drug resistance transporter